MSPTEDRRGQGNNLQTSNVMKLNMCVLEGLCAAGHKGWAKRRFKMGALEKERKVDQDRQNVQTSQEIVPSGMWKEVCEIGQVICWR